MNPVLELIALAKHFPTHRAVDGLSIRIAKGEFFSLIGPSGCGKTTTLRLIAGFENPTSGEIMLEGKPVAALKPYQRDVTTVFQNYALFPHLTVAQNIAFGLQRRPNQTRASIAEKVTRVLDLVQLAGKEDRLPNQISGGERQRVALARSLVLEPKVLLLDEPLSALDPKLRRQMRLELKLIQRRVGIAFLFITHDQEEALSMSDQIAVMNQGKLEQTGTPEAVYRTPATKFVAEFLGDVNWLRRRGRSSRSHPPFAPTSPRRSARNHRHPLKTRTFLGNCIHVVAKLEDGSRCIAELPQQHCDFEPGESVHVWWHPCDEFRL